jgi:hypothetical protein
MALNERQDRRVRILSGEVVGHGVTDRPVGTVSYGFVSSITGANQYGACSYR